MLLRFSRGVAHNTTTRLVGRLAGAAGFPGSLRQRPAPASSIVASTLRSQQGLIRQQQHLAQSFSISSSTVEDSERPNLPAFAPDTKVVFRPPNYKLEVGQHADASSEYPVMAYQYATTTRPDLCTPAAIIKPANGNVADVVKAIQFAHDEGIALACRSSGHHFGGYSSTTGRNIQLDMKLWDDMDWEPCGTLIKVGPGVELGALDKFMAKRGAFLPHGECSKVCVGGHAQSGGFSVDCPRSFGFFVDYLQEFDMLLAPSPIGDTYVKALGGDPETRHITVKRPVKDVTSTENDKLFFSVVGGSPGNFGILTSITVKPLWDKHHMDARTQVLSFPYTEAAYKRAMQTLMEYVRDDDVPADFNMSVTVVQGGMPRTHNGMDGTLNSDIAMAKNHKEIYGNRFPWLPCPYVVVMASWTNMDGDDLPFQAVDDAQLFFDKVMAIGEDVRASESWKHKIIHRLTDILAPVLKPQLSQSYKVALPPSKMNTKFGFPERVQANPYLSVTNCLPENIPLEFEEWFAALTTTAATTKHLYVDSGLVWYGGKYSKCKSANVPDEAKSALAHRDKALLNLYYVHFDNTVDKKDTDVYRDLCMLNMNAVARGALLYMGGDNRWNMFPNQAKVGADGSPVGDQSLDDLKEHYFDSIEDYKQVLSTKEDVDPNHVFTPNDFCVGAYLKKKKKK